MLDSYMTFSHQGYMNQKKTEYRYQSVEELLKAIQEKDERAKAGLYMLMKQQCLPRIIGYILNNSGQRIDAEDKFHDAMIALFEAIEKGKIKISKLSLRSSGEQVSSYLMKIVGNLWNKELRWRRRPNIQSQNEELPPTFDLFPGVVKEAFDRLDQDSQKIFIEFFVRKRSCLQIAKLFGKPYTSTIVKKQIEKNIDTVLTYIKTNSEHNIDHLLLNLVHQSIQEMDSRCMSLLQAFYMKGLRMQAIAEKMNFANDHSAREQKRKCMKKLNLIIAEKLLTQELKSNAYES